MNNKDFLPVIRLLKDVGAKIKSWKFNPSYKKIHSKNNFKTEADLRSHEIIFHGLLELFPGVEIISEENYNDDIDRPEEYWLVDPIDGTSSWYHGYAGYVTQAAFFYKSSPIFGIVYAPEYNNMWIGKQNQGATINGERLNRLSHSERAIFVDNTETPHGIIENIMKTMDETSYMECGSIGLKSVLVADGSADLFIKDIIVRDWDLAPAYVILKEVGGCLSLINGDIYNFSGKMDKELGFIVSRDVKLEKKVLKIIKDLIN